MNQLLPLLLMDLTKKVKEKRTFWFSIWEEEPSMFPYLPSKTVFSKLKPLLVILIWVEKILITNLSNIAPLNSWKRKELILETINVPWEDLEHKLKEPNVFCHLPLKQLLKLTHWLNLRISIASLPEPNSKNSVYLCSKTVFHQLKKYSKTQEWPKTKFMKSY